MVAITPQLTSTLADCHYSPHHPGVRAACVLGTILSRAENHALRENMLVLLCCGPRRVDQLCPRDARRLQMEVEGMTVRSRDSEGVGTSIGKPAGGNVWKHRQNAVMSGIKQLVCKVGSRVDETDAKAEA